MRPGQGHDRRSIDARPGGGSSNGIPGPWKSATARPPQTGRRGGATAASPASPPDTDAAPPAAPDPDGEERVRLEALVQRAQQGDEGALTELRQVLDAHPEFWQGYGDLALQAQAAWLHLIAGPN